MLPGSPLLSKLAKHTPPSVLTTLKNKQAFAKRPKEIHTLAWLEGARGVLAIECYPWNRCLGTGCTLSSLETAQRRVWLSSNLVLEPEGSMWPWAVGAPWFLAQTQFRLGVGKGEGWKKIDLT